MKSKFFLVSLSAITFALSLIYPARLYFLVFIFLVPIFYLAFKQDFLKDQDKQALSFKSGFLWGLIFFAIHFFGYIFMFDSQANGYFRTLIPIILALYCAIYSGIWFFFASLISRYFRHTCRRNKNISWLVFTYLYFSWVRYGIFWIFGKFFGYPFSYPLLPLAAKIQTLHFLPFFGKSILLIFIILISQLIALYLVTFKKKYLFFVFIFLAPFIIGQFLCESQDINKYSEKFCPYLETIGYISPIGSQKLLRPMDQAQEIYYQMVELLDKNHNIKTIFMPESSCQFCLNTHKYVIDLWTDNILGDTIDLLIGAPYQESLNKQNMGIYNCLYHISHGKIKKIYKKTNLMPFAEYVPKFWNNFECFKKLFFQDSEFSNKAFAGLSCGYDKQVYFNCCENITFRPLICSDFFTIKRRDAKKFLDKSSFVLLLPINDSIFPMQYLQDLMLLHAKFEAIKIKHDILYVGYYFSCLISKFGEMRLITQKFCYK